jgi:hypothetical protein
VPASTYDTDAARAHTLGIRAQMEQVFGFGHATVYPVVCGFETDEDALILHGANGETLDVADFPGPMGGALRHRLNRLFPDMPEQICADFIPLVEGNLRHVEKMRRTARELGVEHREWMICLGRGFDFLHTPNLALIIGPYSPDLADPIRKAAGIIQANMAAGRIPDDGFLLLASSPYLEPGMDRARAELKARFLSEFAATVIEEGAARPCTHDACAHRGARLAFARAPTGRRLARSRGTAHRASSKASMLVIATRRPRSRAKL